MRALHVASKPLLLIPSLVSCLWGQPATSDVSARSDRQKTVAACTDLRERFLRADTRIRQSSVVTGGTFDPGRNGNALTGLPDFCRVVGVVRPAITFEVWLPIENWNGNFNGVGGGGFAGVISYTAMASALKRGYAVASTDTGHVETDLAWLKDDGLLADYGHRAIHEITLSGKAVVRQVYNHGTRYSYFTGCSTGGRQGLMEAQRYPNDYDGVLAGAPVNWLVEDMLHQLWAANAALGKPESRLPAEKLEVLASAVLNACDSKDGVVDGLLQNPLACGFEPGQLQCEEGQGTAACLTAAQVETARKVYAGPSSARTGVKISAGAALGSELNWAPFVDGPEASLIAQTVALSLDPSFDVRAFDLDAVADRMNARLATLWNATDPDLLPGARRGMMALTFRWHAQA